MLIAAAGGFIFIVMGSLASNAQVSLDKVVHFMGYAMLGILCIMGLHPKWYFVAFMGIVAAGVGLEYAQHLVIKGRTLEVADIWANSLGLLAGCLMGYLIRYCWAYLRPEIREQLIRHRLVQLEEGEVLYRQGEQSRNAYVLHEGEVLITTSEDDCEEVVRTIKPGEVFGELTAIECRQRTTTAKAVQPSIAYRITAREMLGMEDGIHEHPGITMSRVLAKHLREHLK